jgi:hypothetical protein
MATLPQIDVEQTEPKLTLDEAASELYKIVEGHFDSLGLSEEERDQRYISAREFLDAKDAANATA